ncbi:hypothetical protein BC829DRAFT_447914 [Chytridium lagenaria]|nr:hypothetical protein BC829DRAFT_447914 [Chytridium lagenaria]
MGACLAKEGGADCFDCLDDKTDFGDVEGGEFKEAMAVSRMVVPGRGGGRLGKRGVRRLRILAHWMACARETVVSIAHLNASSAACGGLLEFGEIELVEIIEQACGSGVVIFWGGPTVNVLGGMMRLLVLSGVREGMTDGQRGFLWSDWDIRERGRLGSVAWLR